MSRLSVDILAAFPAVDEPALDALLAGEIRNNPGKIIVLDDDPTGVQTVNNVSVYTDWSKDSIRSGFLEDGKLFFVLTNSRGFTPDQTQKAHEDIARVIAETAKELGRSFLLISRSDSTLRGHYPLETETLRATLESQGSPRFDGEILFPFFPEGGRYTIGNIHYVETQGDLIPAAETEFARDKSFGYTKSDMREYVEEKSGGRYPAGGVTAISLEELRALDISGIEAKLLEVNGFNKVIVNAAAYCDVKVFCIALYRALFHGKSFLYRSAAGFVRVLGGIAERPLLRRAELMAKSAGNGGLVIVGSHTQKTTNQLKELLTRPDAVAIEFQSDLVLVGRDALDSEVSRCIAAEEKALLAGKIAVCYTNRQLLTVPNDTPEAALRRSVAISDAVQTLVGQLTVTPGFLIAKGGITSSDIGTKALHVRRANVLGQIIKGVPVWQTGGESRFPGMPYVIFPGNVGNESSLREAVDILCGE